MYIIDSQTMVPTVKVYGKQLSVMVKIEYKVITAKQVSILTNGLPQNNSKIEPKSKIDGLHRLPKNWEFLQYIYMDFGLFTHSRVLAIPRFPEKIRLLFILARQQNLKICYDRFSQRSIITHFLSLIFYLVT